MGFQQRSNGWEEKEVTGPKTIDLFLQHYSKEIKNDEEATFFIFLAAISKDTEEPQNIFLKGKSGIGKTYVTTKVLELFSPEDVWMLGGLSPTALVHDRGTLVDESGNEIDLALKPTKEQIKLELETENPGVHIGKNVVFKEYIERKRHWDERMKTSYYRVDLHGKVLVFLDAPHPETFARLLPVLSHDKEEISYKFTDKTSRGQLRTSHVKIYGWPTTIFCSTQEKWLHDFSTRSFTITPRTTDEKLRSALLLIGKEFAYPKRSEMHPTLQSILQGIETKLKKENLKVLVPFGEFLAEIVPIYKERVMRDYKHILGYIELNALINMQDRPILKVDDEQYVLAVREDFEKVLTMFQYCEKTTLTGLSGHVIDVFERVMKPLEVFSYQNLVEKSKDVLDYPLSSGTFYIYVRELAKIGWVDEEPDPEDKRKKIITVIQKEENLLSSLRLRFGDFFGLENWKAWLNGVLKLSNENSKLSIQNLQSTEWNNGTEEIFRKYYFISKNKPENILSQTPILSKDKGKEKTVIEKTEISLDNSKSVNQASGVEPSLLQVENINRRESKIIQALKELTRLDGIFEDRCAICQFEGRMDYQATLHDGSWGLLCGKCAERVMKKMEEGS